MTKALSFERTQEVRSACLCFHAQRAARVLARRFDAVLRPLGLTNGQFSLLNALNRPKPVSAGRLAEFLAMDRTTLTAAVKPLERDGLVVKSNEAADKRLSYLTLTPDGHEKLRQAYTLWRRAHQQIEKDLSDPDTLRAGLEMIVANGNNDGEQNE